MIIKKGEREYSVTELSREWKAERVLGGVAVEYKIPKEAAPDAAFKAKCAAEGIPQAQIIKKAIEDFLSQ